jgi:hypothetical protein
MSTSVPSWDDFQALLDRVEALEARLAAHRLLQRTSGTGKGNPDLWQPETTP